MKLIKPLIYLSIYATLAVKGFAFVTVVSDGPDSVVWVQNDASFLVPSFHLDGTPGNILDSASFSMFYMPDDRPIQGARTYGGIGIGGGIGFNISDTFYRAGESLLSSVNYGTWVDFLVNGSLVNNALNGSNNYLAARFLNDDYANYSYGWLRFELNQFANGIIAIDFIGGGVEPAPNVAVVSGAIPEPSALSLLAIGLGGLAMFRPRQRIS